MSEGPGFLTREARPTPISQDHVHPLTQDGRLVTCQLPKMEMQTHRSQSPGHDACVQIVCSFSARTWVILEALPSGPAQSHAAYMPPDTALT